MNETVKVKVVFDADPSEEGKTRDVSPLDARRMVREGRARYATEAQERKAEEPKPVMA